MADFERIAANMPEGQQVGVFAGVGGGADGTIASHRFRSLGAPDMVCLFQKRSTLSRASDAANSLGVRVIRCKSSRTWEFSVQRRG